MCWDVWKWPFVSSPPCTQPPLLQLNTQPTNPKALSRKAKYDGYRSQREKCFIWQRFARNIYPVKRNNINMLLLETRPETAMAPRLKQASNDYYPSCGIKAEFGHYDMTKDTVALFLERC